MMRATSARTLERVKIWRGASLISLRDLVFLDPLVPLEDDPVDHRVFADFDRQIAIIVADLDVGEQLCLKQVPDRLVERFGGVGRTGTKLDIRTDGICLKTLRAGDIDRLDRLFGQWP